MLSSPKEVKRRFSVTDTIAPEMKREKEKILYIRDMIDREKREKQRRKKWRQRTKEKEIHWAGQEASERKKGIREGRREQNEVTREENCLKVS